MSLDSGLVIALMEEGMSQAEIGRMYGVSRQYVNKLARQGGYVSRVNLLKEAMPWEVDKEFSRNASLIGFRLAGHVALDPDNIAEEGRERAESFLNRLRTFNVVLDYNPEYPPIMGLTSTPGFAYLPRTEEDEDFMMKIRPGVKVTPLGNRIWRLPEKKE
ncbi:hypothetical protein [Corynebacterium sp. NML120713]|uniref:hypothetical protein n=1 Tax=Corynebacterium sp. NML120713 TaxID=1906332 RepID=UPI0008FB4EB9|nr:hypothetical protein [Corynebacterium sp. NML120713]OIR43185.1 hypothetical protein BJP06_06290 [Corynebacterium sp. NML120713]